MMDAKYKPSNKQITKIPNLGNSGTVGDIKTPSMHTKYNVMHESRMMEETALMLSLVAASIINLMINPAPGKYSNVCNNAVRMRDADWIGCMRFCIGFE